MPKTTNTTKKSASLKVSKETDKVNSTIKVEESAKLEEENKELKSQLDEMMKNYKEMQLQMQNMLLAQKAMTQVEETPIIVGSRMYNGVTLSSQGGDISIPLGFREEVEIDYAELREIFKNPFNFKNMFKRDILYFVNEEDYKRFNIRKEFALDDDSLVELLENSSAYVITEKMKEMTQDKKNLTQVFAIIYQIAYLIDHKKVDLDYEIRSNLEKYFEVDFKTLINNLHNQ